MKWWSPILSAVIIWYQLYPSKNWLKSSGECKDRRKRDKKRDEENFK